MTATTAATTAMPSPAAPNLSRVTIRPLPIGTLIIPDYLNRKIRSIPDKSPSNAATGDRHGYSVGPLNVTDIRPEYSFGDAQYKGAVNDFRLCSAGYHAAGQGQGQDTS